MNEEPIKAERLADSMNRHWQYSDAGRRRVRWNMNRIIAETRRRGVANASVRRASR